MTKQVRVFDDTAHVISTIASARSVTDEKEITFAEIVDVAIRNTYPDDYEYAMKVLQNAREQKDRQQ